MRHHTQWLNENVLTHRAVLTAVLAISIPFVILACSQQPKTSSADTDKVPDEKISKMGASAMKAYKDPETGKLGAPPDATGEPASSKAVEDAISTSMEGLVEKPAPGGGTMVDLNGRFQSMEGTTRAGVKSPKSTGNPNRASHLKAYIDPETGKLGAPPQTANVLDDSEPMQPFNNTSMDDLVEVPAPGGGMMVYLNGRFQSALIATKNKDGKITTSHKSLPKPN